MCNECGITPCHPRCPNTQEEEKVYTCKLCNEGIEDGEIYYEMDGEFYHEECFEDAAVQILVDECGAMRGVAKKEGE